MTGDESHVWIKASYLKNMEVCKVCGFVRRADRKNSPCRGKSVIVLRTANQKENPATSG